MDQTGVLSNLLRKAYLQREIQLGLADPTGFRVRYSKYCEDGLYYLQRIVAKGLVTSDFRELFEVSVTDSVFNPIRKLTQASFFAIARAKAIEKSFYGTATDEVVELAMLLSIFTNLLDEIVDEAPRILKASDRAFLRDNLTLQLWADAGVPEIPPDADRNPFAALLLEVMVAIISKVTSAPVWKNDSTLKSQFLKASAAAFKAEENSAKYSDLFVIPSDPSEAKRDLRSKSIDWAWAVSLAPACMNGWPRHVNEHDFQTFTKSLGIFGGWIDDLSDIARDYSSNKWSNVFLEIFDLLSFLPSATAEFPALLRNCLADEGVVRHLIQVGIDYHLDVLQKTELVTRDPEPIKSIISDTVLLYISDAALAMDPITPLQNYA